MHYKTSTVRSELEPLKRITILKCYHIQTNISFYVAQYKCNFLFYYSLLPHTTCICVCVEHNTECLSVLLLLQLKTLIKVLRQFLEMFNANSSTRCTVRLKGTVHPKKIKFCHHLLTLKLVQTCRFFFLLLTVTEYILKYMGNQRVADVCVFSFVRKLWGPETVWLPTLFKMSSFVFNSKKNEYFISGWTIPLTACCYAKDVPGH